MTRPPRIAARISAKLRARLDNATKLTGQKESELVRVALERFLDAHKKPGDVIGAVVQSRASKAR